ncbi:MAG TPA: 2,5-diamino-6-(ribosylamino)-4(3H)-pyrimidinone 5'-phosphate reductase [Candidatus Bathyarchaeia archaeon]
MPASRISRPYVILNAAMSLDGKIATYTGDSRMSSPADLRRVHRLRASVDGIMVGMRTLLRDNPKLTVKFAKDRRPYRIIVDSKAQTPLTSYVVRTARETPTIVAVTSRAPKNRIEILERRGVKVFVCGEGRLVSVKILLQILRKLEVRKILLEGGGALNWSMLSSGLVDEVSLAITPRILGGEKAVTLVEGKGTPLVKDGVKLKLLNAAKYGPDLVVRYKVLS